MDTYDVLEQQAGEMTGKTVAKVQFELDHLRRHGLLVDLNISGTGMFIKGANFLELGVGAGAETDARSKRYTPGSKYLIDRELVDALRSCEVRMRQLIEKSAYDVQGFRPYRWLPWNNYKIFKASWDRLLGEFGAVKARIISQYDAQLDKLSDEFADGARRTWSQVKQTGYTALMLKDRSGYKVKSFTSEAQFIDWVVSQAQAAMPSVDDIATKLTADYNVGLVHTEFDDQESAAHASGIKRSAALRIAKAQEKYDHQKRMQQLEQHEKEQALEAKEIELAAMRAVELEHAKTQIASLRSPFEEVFTALRTQIAGDCQEILESLQKNTYLRGKVAERARGLVALYDLIAAHDDKELRAKLLELRAQLGAIGDERTADAPGRDVVMLEKTLGEIVGLAHVQAEELGAMSRAAFLEM